MIILIFKKQCGIHKWKYKSQSDAGLQNIQRNVAIVGLSP